MPRFLLSVAILGSIVSAASAGEGVDSPMDQMRQGGAMDRMDGMMMPMTMRPDMMPPARVMGGMPTADGRLMLALTYARMVMDGNRDGTDRVSTAEVLDQFPVAAESMDVDMVMLSAMYGFSDDLSAMFMLPYLSKEMDHVTRTGRAFTTSADGFGDARLGVNYDLYEESGHRVQLTAGLSLPTGSIDETDDTPAGADQVLPYPMQLGSGTFDLLPAVTYTARDGVYAWGGQVAGTVRLGENDRDYTLGDRIQASVWGSRRWTDWMSSSLRLIAEDQGNIDGADSRLDPNLVQTADPDRRGGSQVSLAFGLNFLVPHDELRGLGADLEFEAPIYRDLDGPQVERDYIIAFRLRRMF